jgi:hypothetical protein
MPTKAEGDVPNNKVPGQDLARPLVIGSNNTEMSEVDVVCVGTDAAGTSGENQPRRFRLQAINIIDRVPDYSCDRSMTGHSVQQIMSGVLAIVLRSVIMSQDCAREICEAIQAAGYVIVPRAPTKEMLDAAWADALDENASAVWSSMIESAEATSQSA